MALTLHPHLQCRGLKLGRAIPLPALRALVARKGGTFTLKSKLLRVRVMNGGVGITRILNFGTRRRGAISFPCTQNSKTCCHFSLKNGIVELHFHRGQLKAESAMYTQFSSASHHKFILSSYIYLHIILFTAHTGVTLFHDGTVI